MNSNTHAPLNVIVVGAGIGGLSAAIALRRAGHYVEIHESSRFSQELGAAIHLPPNVVGLLLRFGLDPADIGANLTEWTSVYTTDGTVISRRSMAALQEAYPYPWRLSHRVDLHENLKRLATCEDGNGPPATIHLRSRVVGCDIAVPSITLENGETRSADLVIGADGVHSTLRSLVTGEDFPAEPSGGSAFRFLIPISQAKVNPSTAHLVEREGELQLWEGKHRRLVIYPCRNNTELNFVCLHPDSESPMSHEGWSNSASIDHLLEVFDEFCEPMKMLLRMADRDTLKLWRLYDRRALSTWVAGKAALLGDAAHPFLPHQGQGGAQAIEDGAALGALFPAGTSADDINERLRLYMQCRYDRATLVQNFSRMMAFKTSEKDGVGGFSLDPLEFSKINFDHDAYDHARGILRRHMAQRSSSGSLPAGFGPTQFSVKGDQGQSTVFMTFKTKKSYLRTLVSCDNVDFPLDHGWATMTCAVTVGNSHCSLGFFIHGVSTANCNGTTDSATDVFLLARLDNDVDRVVALREEHRIPAVFADITALNGPEGYSIRVSRGDTDFLVLRFGGLTEHGNDRHFPRLHAGWTAGPGMQTHSASRFDLGGVEAKKILASSDFSMEWTQDPADSLRLRYPVMGALVSGLRDIKIEKRVNGGVIVN